MAEELGPKTLDETLKQLEKDVKDTSNTFRDIISITRDLQRQTTSYSRTQRDIASSLSGLQSPIITSIANLITTNNINVQNIDLEKQRLAQLQAEAVQNSSKLALHAQEYAATQSKISALNASVEEAQLQQSLARLESDAITSQQNQLNEVVTARKEYLERLHAQNASQSEIDIAQEQLTSANTELKEAYRIGTQVTDLLTSAEEHLKQAEAERTSKVEKLNKSLEDQKDKLDKLKAEDVRLAKAEAEKTREIKELQIKKLRDILNNFSTALSTFVQTIRETQNALGISSANALDVVVGNYAASLKSFFTNATTVSTKEIMAARQSFQAEFGGVITSKAAAELATQAKDLGVTTQELAGARRAFMTTTMGDLEQSKAQQDKLLTTFRQQGLTNKDAMDFVTKNSEIVARNGTRFSQSLFRAAADAKKIGVDLGKLDQIGDNIIGDFEGFLEKTAELGAMGFNLDVNTLGQIAESGDTGALMGELRSQLSAQGKDLTNLRRSEQLALSQAFGVSMGDLQRLAGPTAGSGEETEKQTDEKSLLTIIAEKSGAMLGVLAGISSLMAGIQTSLLFKIAANTGGLGGILGRLGGLIGRGATGAASRLGNLFGRGGSRVPEGVPPTLPPTPPTMPPTPPTVPPTSPTVPPTSPGGDRSRMEEAAPKDPNRLIKGAAAMLIMAAALFVAAKALQEFNSVDWPSVRKAGLALLGLTGALIAIDRVKGKVLTGAAAMVIMGGALWVVGKALLQFNDIHWPSLGKAALAILGLAVAAAALGAPAVAALVLVGSAVLFILGAAVAGFAALIGAALPKLAGGLEKLSSSLAETGKLDGSGIKNVLTSMASGIGSLAVALMAFPTKDLGKVGKHLSRLGNVKSATGLDTFATRLQNIATSVRELSSALQTLDISKLTAINTAITPSFGQMVTSWIGKLTGSSKAPETTTIAPATSTPVVDATTAGQTTATTQNVETQAALPPIKVDLAALEAKLDQVVRAINGMKVEMDGAAVGKMVAAAESRTFQFGPSRAGRQ